MEYTSESVSDGHPDKVADQISDAVLDAVLAGDPNGRVACEVLVKDRLVVIAGEVSAIVSVDYQQIVLDVLSQIYGRPVAAHDIEILIHVGVQSPEIASGVDHGRWIGAGDQGMMFGYACDETPVFLPATIYWAHQLMMKHKALRSEIEWLRSDAKCQVTIRYEDGEPAEITSVVLSSQHTEEVELEQLRERLKVQLIDAVLPQELVSSNTQYFINPSGSFIQGGPDADCGLTGRKIMVDTYGGMALHGGGAFSGKDATKVDRTAAYMARYVAKQIVAAGLARRCQFKLAYAIGVEQPVMIDIQTFGTSTVPKEKILAAINDLFSFTPKAMIEQLGLTQPIFHASSTFGHFGRDEFPWEQLDQVDKLRVIKD